MLARGWAAGLGLALILAGAAMAAPADPLSLDDVLRLQAAGVSDDIIMSESIVTGSVFHLTADDIIRLKEAGISDRLIQFLVDSGLPSEEASVGESEPGDEESEQAESISDEESAAVEEDEEDEDASTTRVVLALNYRYASWWYDDFWWDFWYYDCWYSPYRFSYRWGSWYPVWWSYSGCWASPYAAYRGRYDPWWDWNSCSTVDSWICYSPRPSGVLSQEKWKSNRFGSSAWKTQALAARTSVDTRDFTKDIRIGGSLGGVKHPTNRFTLTGEKTPHDVVRPSEGVRSGHPVKTKAVEGRRAPDARPDRAVRQPASGPRPIKVIRPTPKPTKADSAIETPRAPSGEKATPEKKPTKPQVRRAPQSEKAKPSDGRARVPSSTMSAPSHAAPRAAPAPRASRGSAPPSKAPSTQGSKSSRR